VPSAEELYHQHHERYQVLRNVKKQIKRGRQERPVRQRDWTPDDDEDWDDVDSAASERVLPRGEQERRKAMWNLALQRLAQEEQTAKDGESAEDLASAARAAAASGPAGSEASPSPAAAEQSAALERESPKGQRGQVSEVSTGLCRVDVQGQTVLCTVRRSLGAADTGFTNVVAVGDEVIVALDGAGRGVVEAILPRRSALTRPDVFYSHLQQVIVANADQLLAVASWRNPALWPELLDRYLIAAERHNLQPLICLNKVDLAADRRECRTVLEPYTQLGYRTVLASAVTGEGVAELRELLRGRTSILAGLSGVGKSSLLAAVQPGLNLRIAEVSTRHHAGRHTTTQVNLLKLEMGGQVVDTPGIREFGLSGLQPKDLVRFYPELAAITGCRYANCSHVHEPGCAVRLAVREGRLSTVRYDSYCKIRKSLREG
jgi:ribosome biogenesis GTPase